MSETDTKEKPMLHQYDRHAEITHRQAAIRTRFSSANPLPATACTAVAARTRPAPARHRR